MRKAAKTLALAAASAGAAAAARRLRARRRARVDLYFADGSMIALAEGQPQADRLAALARDVIDATSSER
ncbi:MAG: hypothetical protein KY396_01845 [Actinobacteria bacterium]|nr:hypothetical protein [Actinomycetota bacterium]